MGRQGTCSLYGLNVRSNVPFETNLPQGRGEVDVKLEIRRGRADDADSECRVARGRLLEHDSPGEPDRGLRPFKVFREGDRLVLSFPGAGDFELGLRTIRCSAHGGASPMEIERSFLSPVLSYVLERRERCALHGAVVSLGEHAVGLLAHSGTGKSTLAAAAMRAGAALLSDDILAVDPESLLASPGYPELRLSAASIAALLAVDPARAPGFSREGAGKWRVDVETSGLGRFVREPLPLRKLYVVERSDENRDNTSRVESISGHEAVIELLRYSFIPRLAAAAGLDGARLERLGALAETVPMARLRLRSGWPYLPHAVELIAADLDVA